MLEKIMAQIRKDYSEQEVLERIDDTIPDYVDIDWRDDGCENEYEWYTEHCNNEAEDQVVGEMIDNWQALYNDGKELQSEMKSKLFDLIKIEYDLN
jgi:hypothetical protein